MENNQQRSGERNTSGKQQATEENLRPGQQLPTGNDTERTIDERTATKEQHSESSMPENDNETLGTP